MTISKKELSAVDAMYFDVVEATPFYILLCSKNTGHYWHLLECDMNGHTSYRIYHKHKAQDSFHAQTSRPSIEAACRYIQGHDAFHIWRKKKKAQNRKKSMKT